MSKPATFQIDRAAIMAAAWKVARECADESEQFPHIEGQSPRAAHTFLSYALKLAWGQARKAARFSAASESLRSRLAEIERELDHAPVSRWP